MSNVVVTGGCGFIGLRLAFEAGKFDLPSVRTDSTCIGLRRGAAWK